MAQQFYDLEKVAEILGVSPSEVNQFREQRQLNGYRDGADWKFKVEEVKNLLAERIKARHKTPDDEDVLLSEVELGESDPSSSGTVIGPTDKAASAEDQSDVELADSDINLGSDFDIAGSGLDLAAEAADGGSDTQTSDLDIDLTLDSDLTLEESKVSLAGEDAIAAAETTRPEGAPPQPGELDDDDLVIGGSGSGSDITFGADSGVSLVDPHDSGLSLEDPLDSGLTVEEEPLQLAGEDSLELGEDDMLTLVDGTDDESPTQLATDDDFLLTPLEEAEDDDSESGSQVIALEAEPEAGVAEGGFDAVPMLDEEAAGAFGQAAPEVAPAMAMGAAPDMGPAVGPSRLPEAPYSGWNIASLVVCAVVLLFVGVMCFDLVRNMWSWDTPYAINSPLMDIVLGWMGG